MPEQGSSLIEVGRAVKHCNTLSEVAIAVAFFVLGTTGCSCDKNIDFLDLFVFSQYRFCGLNMRI
jgi:hypothetical protein